MTNSSSVMCWCIRCATQLKCKRTSHLVDIVGCSLHLILNAVKHGPKHFYMYNGLKDFLGSLYFLSFRLEFSDIFHELQKVYNAEEHPLLKSLNVRF